MRKSHTDISPGYIHYLTEYDAAGLYPADLFPDLRMGRFRFVLKFRQNTTASGYDGFAWRGLLGHSLMETECPFTEYQCDQCKLHESCAYHYLYEQKSGEKGFANLPRPYIIFPSSESERFRYVDMTLVGDAVNFLPHIIPAWIKAGENGFGPGREKFKLHEIRQLLPDGTIADIYRSEGFKNEYTACPLADYLKRNNGTRPIWKAHLRTPLRLRKEGKTVSEPDWFTAFKSLAVRMSALARYYCGSGRIENNLWNMLISFFHDSCRTYNAVSWKDLKRYSSRQKKYVYSGGITGDCIVEPEKNAGLWRDWWNTASLFHLGKGVSMGMGKIDIKEIESFLSEE